MSDTCCKLQRKAPLAFMRIQTMKTIGKKKDKKRTSVTEPQIVADSQLSAAQFNLTKYRISYYIN